MGRRHPIIEEAVVASVALALVGAIIAAIYWRSTGLSPWPGLVLAEIFALTWGLLLVVITSPSWNR